MKKLLIALLLFTGITSTQTQAASAAEYALILAILSYAKLPNYYSTLSNEDYAEMKRYYYRVTAR